MAARALSGRSLRESAGQGEPRRCSRPATENRWPVWLQLTWFFVYLQSEDHNSSPTYDLRSATRCEASWRSTPLPRPLGFELSTLKRPFLREYLTAAVVPGEPSADKDATVRDSRRDPRSVLLAHQLLLHRARRQFRLTAVLSGLVGDDGPLRDASSHAAGDCRKAAPASAMAR